MAPARAFAMLRMRPGRCALPWHVWGLDGGASCLLDAKEPTLASHRLLLGTGEAATAITLWLSACVRGECSTGPARPCCCHLWVRPEPLMPPRVAP